MSIIVSSANSQTVLATIDGVASVIPRSLLNADYQRLLGLGMKKIELERGVYNAFPSAITKIGDTLVSCFSSGAGHGNSNRQVAIRSSDGFETFERSVFFENAGAVYDNSCWDGLLAIGGVASFKNVFNITKTASGYENTTRSTINVSGETYAFWSAQPIFTGGKWYCTGYRTSPLPTQTALFESVDRSTWSFVALIAADPDKSFSEAAIVKCLNGDMVAVIREDSGSRDIYLSRCTSGVTSWSTPTLLTGGLRGTQPSLLLHSSGDVILLTGDRTGRSGLDPAGNLIDELAITGISCWRSTDNCNTWSNQVMLASMWSTDGGQPMAIELSDGRIGVLCYLAPGATNGDSGVEPGIYWITFDPEGVV